jgi:outer membrane protein TolC
MRSAGVIVFLVAGVLPVVAQESEGPPRVALADCVRLAMERNPDVASAAWEVEAAVAARASARGNLGPRLRVEANAMRWNSPFESSFSMPGAPPLSFVTREQTTTGLTVSVVQPLGSLWGIFEGYRLRDLGVDAARLRGLATRRDTAYQVTEAFYRLLQATRLAEVAGASVEQVETQVKRAGSFEQQGLVGSNDRLRAELGLAAARQRLIQARGNVTLAGGHLAVLLGLPPDTVIEPAEAPTEPPPVEPITSEEAQRRGLASRVELREVDAQIAQAQAGVRAAMSRFLPQVNAVAGYQRNTGSPFLPGSDYYVGVFLTWDVWEGGATYYGTVEAKARLGQALAARSKVRDGLRLEVSAAHIAERMATEAIEVARRAMAQAEENFRIESRRYEARANTSFDVLDAETLLTQARGSYQTALYDCYIARAALRRAIGETPLAVPGGNQ